MAGALPQAATREKETKEKDDEVLDEDDVVIRDRRTVALVGDAIAVIIQIIGDLGRGLTLDPSGGIALTRALVTDIAVLTITGLALRCADAHAIGAELIGATTQRRRAQLPAHLVAGLGVLVALPAHRAVRVTGAPGRTISTGILGITGPIRASRVLAAHATERLLTDARVRHRDDRVSPWSYIPIEHGRGAIRLGVEGARRILRDHGAILHDSLGRRAGAFLTSWNESQ